MPQEDVYKRQAVICFNNDMTDSNINAVSVADSSEMAKVMFDALREFDRKGVKTVYAHCPPPEGVGLAVYNRLIRAAAFDVISL